MTQGTVKGTLAVPSGLPIHFEVMQLGEIYFKSPTAVVDGAEVGDFPVQDKFGQERSVFWKDRIVWDPWKRTVVCRPLDSINRLHKVVYGRSHKGRDELNAKKSSHIQSEVEMPQATRLSRSRHSSFWSSICQDISYIVSNLTSEPVRDM